VGSYYFRVRRDQLGAAGGEAEQAVNDANTCKGCERRTVRPNCHATCAEYAKYKTELARARKHERKDEEVIAYLKDRKARRR